MKNERNTRYKRQQEHPTPTVIHDYDADQTLLARWLQRGMDQGVKFWALVAGVILVAVLASFLIAGLSAGKAVESEGWTELILAQDVDGQLKAADMPGPAASWALLQAAEMRYQEGLVRLPSDRDAAMPLLRKAHDLFEQAYEKAPPDAKAPRDAPSPRRFAAMGMARALEARGEIDDAIAQYELVAKTWPDTEIGERAKALIADLRKPENRAFYEQLATFKPPEATLPSAGQDLFGLPTGHPPLDAPSIPAPSLGGDSTLGTIPELPLIPPTPGAGSDPLGSPAATPSGAAPVLPSDPFQDSAPAGAESGVPVGAPQPETSRP